jgi:hypothetical protein
LALPFAAALLLNGGYDFHRGFLTLGLVTAVCLSVATYFAVRGWALVHTRAALATFESSGDVFADIARLEAEHPVASLHARTAALETASIAWPLAAAAALAPLSIHFLVAGYWARGEFDGWMGMSYVVVGHVHLFLALLAVRLARRLRRCDDLASFRLKAWEAYGWTVAVSLVPGAVLYVIPPAVVTLTGLFIPLLWHWALRTVRRERALLPV